MKEAHKDENVLGESVWIMFKSLFSTYKELNVQLLLKNPVGILVIFVPGEHWQSSCKTGANSWLDRSFPGSLLIENCQGEGGL